VRLSQVRLGGRVLHLRDPARNLIELFQSIPMEE
jgi:hypothetical protein